MTTCTFILFCKWHQSFLTLSIEFDTNRRCSSNIHPRIGQSLRSGIYNKFTIWYLQQVYDLVFTTSLRSGIYNKFTIWYLQQVYEVYFEMHPWCLAYLTCSQGCND